MSFRKFCKVLKENKFTLTRIKGGHYIYKRNNEMAVVPHSRLTRKIMKNIIKRHKLTL